MSVLNLAAAAVLLQSHPLSLHSILVGIPHNAAAIVVYILSGGSIYWVFKAGLKKPDSEEPEQQD
jgi:hypothetical protein